MKKSIERKEYYLTWIIIFILLDSVVEARLIHLGMNPFVLLSACQIFYKEKKEPREYRTIIMETV